MPWNIQYRIKSALCIYWVSTSAKPLMNYKYNTPKSQCPSKKNFICAMTPKVLPCTSLTPGCSWNCWARYIGQWHCHWALLKLWRDPTVRSSSVICGSYRSTRKNDWLHIWRDVTRFVIGVHNLSSITVAGVGTSGEWDKWNKTEVLIDKARRKP